MWLQWDKLHINNDTYIYCEETGTVECEEWLDLSPSVKSAHSRGRRTPLHTARSGTPASR